MQDGKCKLPSSLQSMQCHLHSDWAARAERGSGRVGTEFLRKLRACHGQQLPLFPWSSSTYNYLPFSFFLFFFKNKSGLKEATKRLCFLLVERRHGFNSLTSSPHTTAQTYGAAGDRGVQDVPGFPLLNPLASPCPGSPTSESPRPLSGPAPRAGGLRRAGPEEVRTGPRLWLRSPLFFLRLLLQHVELPKRQTQGSFPQWAVSEGPREVWEDAGFTPKAVLLTVAPLSLWLAVRLGFLLMAGPCLTLTQKPAPLEEIQRASMKVNIGSGPLSHLGTKNWF